MSFHPQEMLYHIMTFQQAQQVFRQALEQLKLIDHVNSFRNSVQQTPIDSCLDIIQFFMKDFETNQLQKFGNPRQFYYKEWHNRLKNQKPQLKNLPENLLFIYQVLSHDDMVATTTLNKIIKQQTENILQPLSNEQSKEFYSKKQQKLPQNIPIPRNMQERMTYLELYLQLVVNPWQICSFEYIIQSLKDTLLNFDPLACYYDQRMNYNYKLFSNKQNEITQNDILLPSFFIPEQADKLISWRLAKQIMEKMHQIQSPTQIAITLAIIYKEVEITIGKLIELEEYRKFLKKHKDNNSQKSQSEPAIEQHSAVNTMLKIEKIQLQDLGMTFTYEIPDFELSQLSSPISKIVATDLRIEMPQVIDNQMNNFIIDPYVGSDISNIQNCLIDQHLQKLYVLDPNLPEFAPPTKPFGMDEMMPAIIYLIMLTKPHQLMRSCALVENFSLPFVLTNGNTVEYALRTIQAAGSVVAGGFENQKQVIKGLVKKQIKIKKIKYDGLSPLETKTQ